MNDSLIDKDMKEIFLKYINDDTIDYTPINQIKDSYKRLINRYENKVRSQRFLTKFPDINSLIENNAIFHNLHLGKRCFVIGNGPSLNSQNLKLIKNEYTLTVNNLGQSGKFADLQPNYHFLGDFAYFSEETDDLSVSFRNVFFGLLDKMKSISPDIKIFVSTLAVNFIRKYNLDEKYDFVYFHNSLNFYDGFDSFNYSAPQPAYINVVHYAIAWAIYMGFSEIYLLGCDATLMEPSHCYEPGEIEKRSGDYRMKQAGLEEVHRCLALMHHTYAQLLEACQRRNISLVNASAKTLIECLPRKEYESLF